MNASVKKVVFFPFTILKYAGKGVSYLKSLIFNSDLALDPNRLEGSELLEELDKVKKQSADFKREAGKKEIDTNAKLQSFRYVVKNPMGEVIKGIFDAPDITGVRVFLSNEGYEIIEIKHTALSRDVFATGAIQAAKTLMTKDKGLYSLKNIY